MACGPLDFRRQQRERWEEIAKDTWRNASPAERCDRTLERVVDALQADLREAQAAEAQEIERLLADNLELRSDLAAYRLERQEYNA